MTNGINTYLGTYLGLSPTDESKIGLGEIEVTVDEQQLKIRHATGLKINEETVPLEQIRQLSEDEVRGQYHPSSDAYTRTDGFQIGEGAILLFARESAEDEIRLIVRLGAFVEILGITFLYDQEQLARGVFDSIVRNATKEVGDYPFPRLEYGGLHKPKAA